MISTLEALQSLQVFPHTLGGLTVLGSVHIDENGAQIMFRFLSAERVFQQDNYKMKSRVNPRAETLLRINVNQRSIVLTLWHWCWNMLSGLGMGTILVPVAKDEPNTQSQNALEDLFADVEFQASFPPISATASKNVSA
jgi:hypothetical protein